MLAVVAGIALAWAWRRATTPPAVVAIEDGKTIDFSQGRAEVRDDAADREVLAKAKREMDEATADVTFAPTKPAPAANENP